MKKQHKVTVGALIGLTLTLAGCATRPALPLTAEERAAFVIERDLLGSTEGRGVFTAINGTKRSFTAQLSGSWDGKTLTLVEDFVYDDGEIDQKTWRLTRLPNGEYTGTREDVVGTARGYRDGDGFRLEYKMQLPSTDGKKGRVVGFRDILVKRQDGVILNNATVGYYGLRVGSVNLTITPISQ